MDHGGQLLKRVYAYTAEVLQQSLAAVMQGLRAYESHPRLLSAWHEEFMNAVQVGFRNEWGLEKSGAQKKVSLRNEWGSEDSGALAWAACVRGPLAA